MAFDFATHVVAHLREKTVIAQGVIGWVVAEPVGEDIFHVCLCRSRDELGDCVLGCCGGHGDDEGLVALQDVDQGRVVIAVVGYPRYVDAFDLAGAVWAGDCCYGVLSVLE